MSVYPSYSFWPARALHAYKAITDSAEAPGLFQGSDGLTVLFLSQSLSAPMHSLSYVSMTCRRFMTPTPAYYCWVVRALSVLRRCHREMRCGTHPPWAYIFTHPLGLEWVVEHPAVAHGVVARNGEVKAWLKNLHHTADAPRGQSLMQGSRSSSSVR